MAPWYVKLDQFGEPPFYSKALVLCDRDRVPLSAVHSDQQARLRYSVFLLELPWRACASCSYPHVASGGQALLETDALKDAERVYEGARTMMRGEITSPAVRHEAWYEGQNGQIRRVG